MNSNRSRLTKILVTALILAVLFVIWAVLIFTDRMTWFDTSIISAVQGMENEPLTVIMKLFTFLGSSLVAVILTVAAFFFLLLVMKHRRELIMFVIATAGSEALNLLFKYWFHRERPNIHRLIEITGFSFPSGHSMAAFTLYGELTYLLWRHIPRFAGRLILIIVCLALTLLIGISRIYLGVHYPSDVFGGYLVSAAWLMLSIYLFEKFWKPKA